MRRCRVAYSKKSDMVIACEDVCLRIEEEQQPPQLVIFFSDQDMFEYCTKEIARRFPQAQVIGATTYMNLSSRGYGKNGISALAVFSGIECKTGIIGDIMNHPMKYAGDVRKTLSELSSTENTCCIEFTTAFSKGEELVIDTLDSVLADKKVPVFGGSAGGRYDGSETLVSLNGTVYHDTCVYALIHNETGRIICVKENIFKPTGHYLYATDVDCEDRRVYEYNDRTATEVMKELLKCDDSNLNDVLDTHPIGRIADNDIYIIAREETHEDGSISYFSRIYSMTKLALLELDDIEQVWKNTVAKVRAVMPEPSFYLFINCLGRSLLLEQLNLSEKHAEFLTENYNDFVNISGYGEQYGTNQLNQSMLMIMFE